MPSSSEVATRHAPTTGFAVVSFLIGGPLIYWPIEMAFQGDVIHAPISVIAGIFVWSILLLSIDGWFMSWIPTLAAAVICAYLLRALARNAQYYKVGRGVKILVSATLCGLVSGAIYFLCSQVAGIIHPPPPGYAEAAAQRALTEHYPLGIRLGAFGGGVLVVIVTGTIIGTWLAWRADIFNASIHANTSKIKTFP